MDVVYADNAGAIICPPLRGRSQVTVQKCSRHFCHMTRVVTATHHQILSKKNARIKRASFLNKSLAMSYFHMGKPHTIIGAERFHF